jgi:cytochrome c oxidase subunit II
MVHGWTNLSSSVDSVFLFIMAISVILLAGVTGVMLYFVVRYSRRRNPRPENIEGNLALEIIWTAIPLVLVMAIFWVGWKGFVFMRTVPKDAMVVKVTGRMWSWGFEYGNGARTEVLKLPLGRPVKLAINSVDVLHSLFIPAFRVKEDAVPGRETYLWFRPEPEGTYDLFCTEYCGMGHSSMITKVEVMPAAAFDAWYREGGAKPGKAENTAVKAPARAPNGARLVQEKGCLGCHSIDGSPKIGPTFKGLFGKKETVIHEGKEVEAVADEAFLRHKLLEPEEARIKGYPPIMPSQKGLLTDAEIAAVIEHLKTLR